MREGVEWRTDDRPFEQRRNFIVTMTYQYVTAWSSLKTKCLRDVSCSQSQVPIHLGNPILLPTELGTCATEHRAVRGGGGWLVMFVRSRWLTKINSCFVTTHCTLTYLLSMLRVYQQLLFRTRYYYKHGGQCACQETCWLCSILTTPCSWPRPGPENWSDR